MADDFDPTAPVPNPSTRLRYAIRSAQAVVQALIARDRDAAEHAALRTCRDCDLLIHLILELISVLRDPCNEHRGLSPRETLILARRAEQVLALVEGAEADDSSPARRNQVEDTTARTQHLHARSLAEGTKEGASMLSPLASQSLTVASTGLRVRLIPVDNNDSGSPAGEDGDKDHSKRAPSTPGSRAGER